MKKIMFNDKYGLTDAVLNGNKTQTRRIGKDDIFSIYLKQKEYSLVIHQVLAKMVCQQLLKIC